MSNEQPLLSGRYRLVEMIGAGGMAEVWRAQDERLDREVAVKKLRTNLATDSTFQARFNREAQAAAGLNHPNIVSVYDTGSQLDENGVTVPYIVMELVQGRTLRDILKSGEKLIPATAFRYTCGILDALAYSHRHGIIHRDIKPANVMLTASGQIKVMDFGIARAVADTSATMTQTAAIIGTAQYLSPEQARGETVDTRSDLYSTGCLLYELLTSRPPFKGDSPVSVAYQHVREAPTPPSKLDVMVSTQMDAIVLKALAKDPADRYQSAEEMRNDCTRLLNGDQVTAVLAPVTTPSNSADATKTLDTVVMDAEPATQRTRPARALESDEELAEITQEAPKKKRKLGPASIVLIVLLVLLLGALGFFVYQLTTSDPDANLVSVPAVIDTTEESARTAISNAKLVPNVVYEEGPEETKGRVVKQDPEAGKRVEVSSTVNLTVNSGPKLVELPDGLIGATKDEARKILNDAGFKDIVTMDAPASKETPDMAADTVVDVSPASGTAVTTDTQITLYLATGKSSLPRVIGMSEAEAQQTLAAAGFTNVAIWEDTTTNESEKDKVIRQNPEGNSMQPRTASITLTVARYTPPASPPARPTNNPNNQDEPQPNEGG